MKLARRIAVTGMTETHEMKVFTGIVRAVDYIRNNPPSVSWRVTMIPD